MPASAVKKLKITETEQISNVKKLNSVLIQTDKILTNLPVCAHIIAMIPRL